jgi:hypothetical protein
MKKSELLRALQTEIQKHDLSTFMDEKDKVVITGCTLCRKHFGTMERFKFHITDDVLPQLLDRLSVEANEIQARNFCSVIVNVSAVIPTPSNTSVLGSGVVIGASSSLIVQKPFGLFHKF